MFWPLMNAIKRGKKRILRKYSLPLLLVFERKIEGKRPRWRKTIMILDDIKYGGSYVNANRRAEAREKWRRLWESCLEVDCFLPYLIKCLFFSLYTIALVFHISSLSYFHWFLDGRYQGFSSVFRLVLIYLGMKSKN